MSPRGRRSSSWGSASRRSRSRRSFSSSGSGGSSSVKQLWAPWRLEYVSNADDQPGCVFCGATEADSDEDALVVYRGSAAFVLLNKYPYASGHLMVAPVRHVGDFAELAD